MEPCQTCGEALAADSLDLYCVRCLDRRYAELADALLEAFLPHYWDSRRAPRRVPAGESRWWLRPA
jgi:hypothetical protein